MSATLILVRHGNTFGPDDTPTRVGARTDLPLVASGHMQAERLGAAFADRGIVFERVLVSPLTRTRETAALILARQAAPPAVEPCDWLAEIDHGPDENRTDDAVIARIGAAALKAWEDSATPPPDWTVNGAARIAAWRALFADAAGGADRAILLVTSNGAARFALLADAGLAEAAKALPSLKLRTGAWGRIAIAADGPRLLEWDRRP
ncbi:MAG TPA: histidine phosphatase family protein [Sphingomonas sp.]